MSSIGNKEVFSNNLTYFIEKSGKSQKEICETLNFSRSTFNEWVKGRKYPRIDKIEMLANYFGILKSDLIEDKSEIRKNNDAISDIIVKMRTDQDFLDLISMLYELNDDKIADVINLLKAFLK